MKSPRCKGAGTELWPLLLPLLMMLGGCSGAFFYPHDKLYITPDKLGFDYRPVTLETDDGETLQAWWLKGKAPLQGTVYFLHGNAENRSTHFLSVAWMTEQGYDVFVLDYRGYGGSSGSPTISTALADTHTGYQWLQNQQPKRPIILLGQSLGGAMGTVLAGQSAEDAPFDYVVIDAAFSGFRGIAQEKLGDFWLTWLFQVPLSWTITADYEPIDYVNKINSPLLIIHSRFDSVIPYHHGVRLYESATLSPKKKMLTTMTPHIATFNDPESREALLTFLQTRPVAPSAIWAERNEQSGRPGGSSPTP